MKKKLAILLGAAVLSTSLVSFTACGADGEKKVMNMSLNPEVEFVLDENDKVLSVNAINEEGNLIISAEAFANVEGKSAEAAAKLFIQVSKEYGFLLEGSLTANENEISISFSGDTEAAKALFNDVKEEVSAYLSSIDVQAAVSQAAAVTEEQLRALVDQCAPYIDAAQLSYDQLMEEIAKSREETQGMFSQYLKEAFYVEKTVALQKAELDVLREKGGVIVQGVLNAVESTYNLALEKIEEIRLKLLDPDGAYQQALTSFRQKKAEFLNYRESVLSGDDDTGVEQYVERLNQIKNELEQVENALVSAGDTAHQTLDTVREAITGAYTSIVNSIKSVLSSFNTFLDEIEAAQETASVEFSATFETEYGTYVLNAKADWNEMRVELIKTLGAE